MTRPIVSIKELLNRLAGELQNPDRVAAVRILEPSDESRANYPGMYSDPEESKATHEHAKKNEEKYKNEIKKHLPKDAKIEELVYHPLNTGNQILLSFFFSTQDMDSKNLKKLADSNNLYYEKGKFVGQIHLNRIPE